MQRKRDAAILPLNHCKVKQVWLPADLVTGADLNLPSFRLQGNR